MSVSAGNSCMASGSFNLLVCCLDATIPVSVNFGPCKLIHNELRSRGTLPHSSV
jgi:hypothetical protein